MVSIVLSFSDCPDGGIQEKREGKENRQLRIR